MSEPCSLRAGSLWDKPTLSSTKSTAKQAGSWSSQDLKPRSDGVNCGRETSPHRSHFSVFTSRQGEVASTQLFLSMTLRSLESKELLAAPGFAWVPFHDSALLDSSEQASPVLLPWSYSRRRKVILIADELCVQMGLMEDNSHPLHMTFTVEVTWGGRQKSKSAWWWYHMML